MKAHNPTDAFTKNKFVDKLLKIVPEDPIAQTQYIYYLTCIVFTGLFGFATMAWINVFTNFNFFFLFQGIFMLAISLLSLMGLKSSRGAYLMMKSMKQSITPQKEMEVESVDDMMDEFK